MEQLTDTIAAIATPAGNGGIGIIRISGPQARDILSRVFSRAEAALAHPRTMTWGLVRGQDGMALDRPLAVWMPGPASYTGEDTAELHCHGGGVLLRLVLATVIAAGARPAEAGEFTLRAYLHGRLDLSQAEAVADLIAARTGSGAAQALAQMDGALRYPLKELEQQLTDVLGDITVGVDFPEEADSPEGEQVIPRLRQLIANIDRLTANARQGLLRRDGASVVLTGVVNAGKSSLLNAMIGRERAIVTAEPGATRDVLEESIALQGVEVRLSDTAGFRQIAGLSDAERQGLERSQAAMEAADLILAVVDATDPVLTHLPHRPTLYGLNKCDLATAAQIERAVALLPEGGEYRLISARTGQGLEQLLEQIAEMLQVGPADSLPAVTSLRHLDALIQARDHLQSAVISLSVGVPADVASIDITAAAHFIGEITGAFASDALLGNIFSRFCVGK